MLRPRLLLSFCACLFAVYMVGAHGAARGSRNQQAHGQWPVIVPATPAESKPVPANSPLAYIAARIVARHPIARVEMMLDRRTVVPHLMGRDALHESVFYQPRHLPQGLHDVRLTVWDAAGYRGWRHWVFRIVAPRGTR